MAPLPKNEKLILDLLSAEPHGLTRKELAEKSGLSRPTVTSIVQSLQDNAVVREEAPTATYEAGARRGGKRVVIDPPADVVVGVDQGHRHVRVAVADRNGNMLKPADAGPDDEGYLQEEPYDVDRLGPSALKRVYELAAERLERVGRDPRDVSAICIGLPAPLIDGRVASPSYLPSWSKFDVEAQLRAVLAGADRGWSDDLPIAVENDANLGALGEAARLATIGVHDFAYIKASSGIGLGIVRPGGTLHRGYRGVAGEFGHVTAAFDAEGHPGMSSPIALPRTKCRACGKLNCLENLASSRAIVEQLKASTEGYAEGVTIEHVVSSAVDNPIGHPLCRRAIVNSGMLLGYAIADLIRILDPQAVVVGGTLAAADDLLLEGISEAVRRASLGLADVPVKLVPTDRIRVSEVEGAVRCALSRAADTVRASFL